MPEFKQQPDQTGIVVLYEDEWVLAINKPAGMVVNRAESIKEITVQDWLIERFKIHDLRFPNNYATEVFRNRAGIAHRLDKETSGVLLIAKDPVTLSDLMRQFKEREIHKVYTALVYGRLEPAKGWFHLPLKRKGIKVRKFGVDALGKMSDTDYEVIRHYQDTGREFSLVSLYPKTGRTHQLRVQLAFYKHPIVADTLYATKKEYEATKEWCPRHFLHATKITLVHPVKKISLMISAPLPKDLNNALSHVQL